MRIAKCTACTNTAPSDSAVRAFFRTAEQEAEGKCVCGYHAVAHESPARDQPHLRGVMGDGHPFTQRPPAEFDSYYCGCFGWD